MSLLTACRCRPAIITLPGSSNFPPALAPGSCYPVPKCGLPAGVVPRAPNFPLFASSFSYLQNRGVQVELEHLQLLPVLEADDVVGEHGFLDRHRRGLRRGHGFGLTRGRE